MKKVMVLTAAAMLLLVSAPGRADTESPALAKYRARVDLAVKKALAFIATRQKPDGSFKGPGHSQSAPNAVAGLAGMAFLSVGHTPGRGPYGDVIDRCIDYVLATPFVPGRAAEGYLVRAGQGRMYSHAIATLFLCEVSGMVDPERQKKIDAILPKALKIILTAQAVPKKEARYAGGWRYTRTSNDSDLSISGWNLMALRSARLNGAPVPAGAIAKAIGYVERSHNPKTGGFDYEPGWPSPTGPGSPPSPAMSAVGLLCRELSGRHNDAINRRCGDYLLKQAQGDLFTRPDYRVYGIYYASQAMFQLGGTYWEQFAPRLYKYLLNFQGTDGRWDLYPQGPVYTTSMFVLSLTVTYRQLPIYQR